jgi:hypothetical protein
VSAPRVIPIKLIAAAGATVAEDASTRLEQAGFMRMMVIGEPRLSEFVNGYHALGYDVEVVPYRDEDRMEMIPDCATIYVRKRV